MVNQLVMPEIEAALERMADRLGIQRGPGLTDTLRKQAQRLSDLPTADVLAVIEAWPEKHETMPTADALEKLVKARHAPEEKPAAPRAPRRPFDLMARAHELERDALERLEASPLGTQAKAEGWWPALNRWAREVSSVQAQTIARAEALQVPISREIFRRPWLYCAERVGPDARVEFDVPAEVIEQARAHPTHSPWPAWQARARR